MKSPILITASSFPLDQQSTKGNFILEFAHALANYHEVIVLTHRVGAALSQESFGRVKVHRYDFLPFGIFSKYFTHGVLHAFSTYKWLFLLIAPLYFLCQLVAVTKLVKRHKIELIHAHWIIPQGLAAVLYRKLINKRIKIISTIHGGDWFAFKGKMGTALKKMVINNVDQLTVVSNHIAKDVKNHVETTPVQVLPMGVNINKFTPHGDTVNTTEKTPLLLFVGRLTEKKGITYLIAALPQILQNIPAVQLWIVGSGPLEEQLKQQANTLNIEQFVTFTGNVNHTDLPKYYRTADLFIGPSVVAKSGDSEGFGLVFAEAAACQALVITTDFPAMADIIINKKTGYTVAQKSAVAIVERVIYCLRNPTVAQQIAVQGKQHVNDNFSWQVIGQQYADLYQKTLY